MNEYSRYINETLPMTIKLGLFQVLILNDKEFIVKKGISRRYIWNKISLFAARNARGRWAIYFNDGRQGIWQTVVRFFCRGYNAVITLPFLTNQQSAEGLAQVLNHWRERALQQNI